MTQDLTGVRHLSSQLQGSVLLSYTWLGLAWLTVGACAGVGFRFTELRMRSVFARAGDANTRVLCAALLLRINAVVATVHLACSVKRNARHQIHEIRQVRGSNVKEGRHHASPSLQAGVRLAAAATNVRVGG